MTARCITLAALLLPLMFSGCEQAGTQQPPWLFGASVLLLVSALILLCIVFQRKRLAGKELEGLVHERTLELEMRTAELGKQQLSGSILNDAAVLLLEADAEDYEDALARSMERVCRCMQTDRVYLWQNTRKDDGKLYYRLVCKWMREDCWMDAGLWDFAYQDTLPRWEGLLARKNNINGPVDSFPEEEQAFLTPFQFRSLLVVPLFLRGGFWGFASFEDCRNQRFFSEAEEYVLRSWGLLAVGVIQRGEIAQGMRQTLTKLEAVISNYKGVIWSINNSGVITTCDGQYLRTAGIEPSSLVGKELENVWLQDKHPHLIENIVKTFLEGPQDWIGAMGESVFRSCSAPMYDGQGNILGIVGSTDDVTAAVKLRQDLETAVEAAKAANHAKSVFLANMSHEIRTPMNAVVGIAEIQLQDETLAPAIRDAFGRIRSSSDLLLGIINDILDMSKIEVGKLELIPDEYHVASLIADAAQLNMVRSGSKRIEFELHVEENTPAVVVGDALRVKQILNNVLSNAFKYTQKGRVRLAVFPERESKDACVTLVFRVSDTGQGMTAEQLSRLFDAYTRFNQEANRTIEGTGLGMSITRNLVRMMNGEISVESEPDRGSTFTVRLPQRDAGVGALGREMAESLRQFRMHTTTQMKRAQIVREAMPYGRVLVVDDVETNIYVATGLLAPYGLTVDSAGSGFEALEKIRQGEVYDIVLMDHMMPEMDGIEALHAIRDTGYTKPVVALTANAVAGQAEIFKQSGFDDFLAKPIDLRLLNAVLNKFVRDPQPPEVLEAVRRQHESASAPGAASWASANPKLAAIFMRDALKSLAVLGTLCEQRGAYTDEDIRGYITNIHGMRGALANIGETALAALAFRLEQAGRARDLAVMASETPAFLNALRTLLDKITPQVDNESSGMTNEGRAYLREKLLVLKTACASYDKKTVRDALNEIEQKAWPRPIGKQLDTIAELLLHSKLKKITSLVDEMIGAL
jgi:signal transduction histidine kinase